MRARFTFAALLLIMALVWCASPASAQIDALCTASVTLNFDPPATVVLPPTPAPHTTSTGGGTITECVVFDGGPTTGTFTFELEGEMTCSSAENIEGTLDIVWADNTESHTEVTTLLLCVCVCCSYLDHMEHFIISTIILERFYHFAFP